MTEPNKKKVSSVKLFDTLIDELDQEKKRRIAVLVSTGLTQREAEKQVDTYADIVQEAWDISKENTAKLPTPDTSALPEVNDHKITVTIPTEIGLLLRKHQPAVTRLLYILEADFEPAAAPLTDNLYGFCVATDLAVETGKIAAPAFHYQQTGGVDDSSETLEKFRENVRSASRVRERAEEAVKHHGETPKNRERGKKLHAVNARKRGGD